MTTDATVLNLPSGTVTFLFTDVEGSTKLWEEHPEQMRRALSRHDAIVELLTQTHAGQVVRPRGEGDSRFCVFPRASDAVSAAAAIQTALHVEPWPPETTIRVRIALHTGEADLRDGDYYGSAVNRAARIRSLAHGGQTLLSQVTFDLVRDALPPDASVKDLGQHRLKDLGRSEGIVQILPRALRDSFPPLKSLDTLPNNLPLQVTSFVGRERELAEVKRLLSGARLLTLTGTGGAGKTRLALQAAADVIDAYPDGVWFVDLAPLADPTLVAGTALTAMGAGEPSGQSAQTTVISYLKQRHALVVLDNCEHVIETCARLVDAVIHQCRGVRVLTTSREMLGVSGETAWRVPSLSLPELDNALTHTAQSLEQYEAVRLFIDRALAVDPTFQVTNENAPAVAQVCHRLDGIPLAIELAAARVRVLSVDQIAARLDDRFRLLTGGGRTALRRQQTLQALVDWSHELLSEPERALFRRLAVFAGGFTLDATESVCTGDPIEAHEILDLLTSLVDKSLVVSTSATDADQRYRLLETMRQYAEDKLLQAGDAAPLRDRHLQWCVALARGVDQAGWLPDAVGDRAAPPRLSAEGDNVRAALTWGASTPEGASLALELLSTIGRVPRAPDAENVRWLETLLAAVPARTRSRARALIHLDMFRRWQHDFAGARAAVEEARAIAGEIGDEDLASHAAVRGALVAANLGEYASAVAELERCLGHTHVRGFWRREEHVRRCLGIVLIAMGDFPRARATLDESRALGLQHGAMASYLRSRLLLCVIDHLTGDLHGARTALEALCEEMGTGSFSRSVLQEPARWALANVARDEGRFDQARRLLVQSLHDLQRYGEVGRLSDPTCMVGLLDIAAGHVERGVTLIAACAPESGPIGTVHVPELRVEAPLFLDRARATLGGPAYDAAWARGRRMSLEEAVDLAVTDAAPELTATIGT